MSDTLQSLLSFILRVLLHCLSLNQSSIVLQNMFATQRSLVSKVSFSFSFSNHCDCHSVLTIDLKIWYWCKFKNQLKRFRKAIICITVGHFCYWIGEIRRLQLLFNCQIEIYVDNDVNWSTFINYGTWQHSGGDLAMQSEGCRLDSDPSHCCIATLAKLFTPASLWEG